MRSGRWAKAARRLDPLGRRIGGCPANLARMEASVVEAGRRAHLLVVAWAFPPCRAGGVYRALATANAFAASDWRVTVLTAEREYFLRYGGADPTLEEHIDARIRVERIPFYWPVLETDVRRFSALRVYAPRVWSRLRKRLDRLPFPEVGYGPWRSQLETAADRIHADHPVDLCLATANPYVDFTAAWRLHKRGVPYVMDYRDAWSLDVFSGARLNSPKDRAGRWERRLIAGAKEVWFVNQAIRAWHTQAYPEYAAKMHVVANGYDSEFAVESSTSPIKNRNELVFGYVGTISPQVPLAALVEGWRLARQQSELLMRSRAELYGYLGHYQTPSLLMQRLLNEAVFMEMRYYGPIPKTDVRAVYDRFDTLLLVLGTGRYVTSGKVYEYVATGLPIVSVHDSGNAASDVLQGYPLWFPVKDLSPTNVADALTAAAEAAATADPEKRARAQAFASQYRREHQLNPRISALGSTYADSTSVRLGRPGR
jgi:glycosyltransferase involved in cell wall biosynthesis